jgi:hypothetical protein
MLVQHGHFSRHPSRLPHFKCQSSELFQIPPVLPHQLDYGFVLVLIRQDAEGRFSLNDLHKAAGSENRHRPSIWIGNQQTQALIAEVAKAGNTALKTVKGGNAPGTFVAWQLVYAYAMWVSPSFHLKVIRAYDALVTSQVAAPADRTVS